MPAPILRDIEATLARWQLMSRYLTRREAAKFFSDQLGLPVSHNTLTKWATTGGGPEYRLFGNRAVYDEAALRAWAEEKLSTPRTSTSAAA
jgi:hypothetical protein